MSPASKKLGLSRKLQPFAFRLHACTNIRSPPTPRPYTIPYPFETHQTNMEELNHLFGACSCERNQYTVVIPTASASQAQVYFDNGLTNRKYRHIM